MKAGRAADRRDDTVLCHLFYGPDEAGSRTFAARLAASFGEDVDRVDLAPAALRADPALLADEAASASLFGGRRYIRVDTAGDECVAAVGGLLSSGTAMHPVLLIAGAIRKDSRLVKMVDASPFGRVVASYTPDAAELARIATTAGAPAGLRIDSDMALRLVEAAASDRAVLLQEIEKLADYLDATPDRPQQVTADHLDAIGAQIADADTGLVVSALAAGDVRHLDSALSALGRDGQDAVAVVRGALRRLLAMAAVRAEMGRGTPAKAAVDRAARTLFWKEKEAVTRDIPRWSATRLEAAIDRLVRLERQLKSSGGAGPVAVDRLLHAIARSIRR